MSLEKHRLGVAEEIERAARCLDEARALRAHGFPDGTIARAYFGAFHAARALVFSRGIEVRRDRATIKALGEHFVETSRLAPELAQLVARLHSAHHDTEWKTGAVFTDAMAGEAIDEAERFLAEARRLLT
jgi:uncharacterized protein (UPF0332 family)